MKAAVFWKGLTIKFDRLQSTSSHISQNLESRPLLRCIKQTSVATQAGGSLLKAMPPVSYVCEESQNTSSAVAIRGVKLAYVGSVLRCQLLSTISSCSPAFYVVMEI
jgi:hypothetical protein